MEGEQLKNAVQGGVRGPVLVDGEGLLSLETGDGGGGGEDQGVPAQKGIAAVLAGEAGAVGGEALGEIVQTGGQVGGQRGGVVPLVST